MASLDVADIMTDDGYDGEVVGREKSRWNELCRKMLVYLRRASVPLLLVDVGFMSLFTTRRLYSPRTIDCLKYSILEKALSYPCLERTGDGARRYHSYFRVYVKIYPNLNALLNVLTNTPG